jgi:hypothetical protein
MILLKLRSEAAAHFDSTNIIIVESNMF